MESVFGSLALINRIALFKNIKHKMYFNFLFWKYRPIFSAVESHINMENMKYAKQFLINECVKLNVFGIHISNIIPYHYTIYRIPHTDYRMPYANCENSLLIYCLWKWNWMAKQIKIHIHFQNSLILSQFQ